MKKYSVHIIWAVAAAVLFVGGLFYGKSMAPTGPVTRAGFTGPRTSPAGGFVAGEITSLASSSLTLQLANGNSVVVFYSTSTTVSKPTTVPAAALTTGTSVMVGGTQNSDGSLTAQSIQVRPAGR